MSILKAIKISHSKGAGQDGWEYPRGIDALLREMTAGGRVLQLFGGRSGFGIRLDIDPVVRPDVIGDAWLPPFKRDSFDHVVIDPPYDGISTRWYCELMVRAAWCARQSVIWWNTKWFDPLKPLELVESYLVSLGNYYQTRCLLKFAVKEPKREPGVYFNHGPAVKYNWSLAGQTNLQFNRDNSEDK